MYISRIFSCVVLAPISLSGFLTGMDLQGESRINAIKKVFVNNKKPVCVMIASEKNYFFYSALGDQLRARYRRDIDFMLLVDTEDRGLSQALFGHAGDEAGEMFFVKNGFSVVKPLMGSFDVDELDQRLEQLRIIAVAIDQQDVFELQEFRDSISAQKRAVVLILEKDAPASDYMIALLTHLQQEGFDADMVIFKKETYSAVPRFAGATKIMPWCLIVHDGVVRYEFFGTVPEASVFRKIVQMAFDQLIVPPDIDLFLQQVVYAYLYY